MKGRVCAAMRRQDLTKGEEGGEESASSGQWAGGHRNPNHSILVLKADVITAQTPSMIRGIEGIANGKDSPN